MHSFTLYVGLWMTTCIQSQMDHREGHVIESYEIVDNGQYQYKKTWYNDSSCTSAEDETIEMGQITLGAKIQGMFMSDETREANFHTNESVDLGALSITSEGSLKVARGFKGSSFRNTMLSIFDYKKQ